jgi:hypothetical protein
MSKDRSNPEVSDEEISWLDVELKLAILQVLVAARRAAPIDGGATLSDIKNIVIPASEEEIQDALTWLIGQWFVTYERGQFLVTVLGVDFLCDELPLPAPIRIEEKQIKQSGWCPPPPGDPTDYSLVRRRPRPAAGAGEIALPLPTPRPIE